MRYVQSDFIAEIIRLRKYKRRVTDFLWSSLRSRSLNHCIQSCREFQSRRQLSTAHVDSSLQNLHSLETEVRRGITG